MSRLRALVPDVLRTEREFRLLFAGQVLSLIGDRVLLVALPFAVLEAGGGVREVGLVFGAQLVPFLLFALVGGVLSDRSDRRRVLIASDVARLAVQAAAGALLVAGAADPLSLGVLAALYGTADAFFQPAFTGLLPQTVSHPGQLQPANALRGMSFSVSSVAGPSLAGVLVATRPGRPAARPATALMSVGTALAGPVAEALGTQATLFGMSAVGVACALTLLAVPGVRRLPRGPGAGGEPAAVRAAVAEA
jgi:MFS family permease